MDSVSTTVYCNIFTLLLVLHLHLCAGMKQFVDMQEQNLFYISLELHLSSAPEFGCVLHCSDDKRHLKLSSTTELSSVLQFHICDWQGEKSFKWASDARFFQGYLRGRNNSAQLKVILDMHVETDPRTDPHCSSDEDACDTSVF